MPSTKVQNNLFDIRRLVPNAFHINEEVNQFLLKNLIPAAWQATSGAGKGHMGSLGKGAGIS
jgi:hypothetical protein